MTDRNKWLNGWPLMEGARAVLIGTGVHCSGCGKDFGVATVAFPPGYKPPGRLPDWPFEEANCPVHSDRNEPTLAERLRAFKAAKTAATDERGRPMTYWGGLASRTPHPRSGAAYPFPTLTTITCAGCGVRIAINGQSTAWEHGAACPYARS